MKNIIVLCAGLLLATAINVVAEESPFEGRHNQKPLVYTECKAGYMFIIASSKNGIAIMQVFQDAGDMVPKPIECECPKDNEEK